MNAFLNINVSARGDDWHAARLGHVGASECSALFGLQPAYALSHYALWNVKAGLAPPPPVENERVRWGLRLEPYIAAGAAEEHGWRISKGGYVVDPTVQGMGCTLDYVIEEPGEAELEMGFSGPGAMELKNADWLVHKRAWLDDEPPEYVLIQHQHQLACTGFTWGVVACLVGGNDLRVYRYPARPKLIVEIRNRVRAFWQSIADGREPKPDGSDGAMHVIRERFKEFSEEIGDLNSDNRLPVLCADLLKATEQRKTIIKTEDDLKAEIQVILGQAGVRKAWAQEFFLNLSITPPNPGRPAKPGEIIGARKEVRRLLVKEKS